MPEFCWCGGTVTTSVDSVDSFGGKPVCQASEFHDPTATGRPAKVVKLYLAGCMSGYEDCNYPEFNRVAKDLREAGYEVANPAEYGNTGSHYVDLLREDLKILLNCDGVAMLDNWWESVGARNEVNVAGLLMMPVKHYKEWLT